MIEKDWTWAVQDMDTLVLPKRVPVEVTMELVHQVLGLNDVGVAESQSTYAIEEEILSKGIMH